MKIPACAAVGLIAIGVLLAPFAIHLLIHAIRAMAKVKFRFPRIQQRYYWRLAGGLTIIACIIFAIISITVVPCGKTQQQTACNCSMKK